MKCSLVLVSSVLILLFFGPEFGGHFAMAQNIPEPSQSPCSEAVGIETGEYAPDFQLEPIEPHADFARWLGDDAPKGFDEAMRLSVFRGHAPVILLFGSFT